MDIFEKSFNICLLFISSIKPCYQQLRQGGSLTARLFPIACLNRGLQIRLSGHAILDRRKELGFSLPSPKVVFLVWSPRAILERAHRVGPTLFQSTNSEVSFGCKFFGLSLLGWQFFREDHLAIRNDGFVMLNLTLHYPLVWVAEWEYWFALIQWNDTAVFTMFRRSSGASKRVFVGQDWPLSRDILKTDRTIQC